MLILGIDPGIGRVGWALVESRESGVKSQDYGCLETKSGLQVQERLKLIFDFLSKIIKENKPDVVCVEELFFATNSKTASVVGEARGVILLCAVLNNVSVATYTPLQVKLAITGYGRADKNQIQAMVKSMLGLKEIPRPDDAADALAIALAHASSYKLRKLL
jgi:crossover junction endodeoxyribonuclease RuvC